MNIIELAKQANGENTYFDGELVAITFAVANLEKFVEIVLRHQALDELTAESQRLGMYDKKGIE